MVLKGADGAHGLIARSLGLLFTLVVAVVLAYSFWPPVYEYAVPIGLLAHQWLNWTGVALLMLSLAWTIQAQAQMGESWRIGIDTQRQTPLVQAGIFGKSRNPIFLGMMVTLLGLFLVVPNVLTLLVLIVGVVLIQIQVRLEEGFLGRMHGEDYDRYRRRVRRWI